MQKCPCHGCTDRYVGCHGKCQAYQDWKTCEEERKEAIKKQAEEDAQAFSGVYKHRWR